MTTTTANPQTDRAFNPTLALILGGLVVLALAIWGFIALGRRRSPAQRMAEPVIERPILDEPAPIAAEPVREPIAWAPRLAATAPALSNSGAAVALPRTLPDSLEERDALLWRMVDAKPDRANPFTERRARIRRAKLIMQSIGKTFDREPRIDLSQYPQNWPELARNDYATAA